MTHSSDPRSAEPSDAELIAESRDRPEAFAGLFDRHWRIVYHYIVRRLGREVAEDLVGETFLAAFERRHRFDARYTDARHDPVGQRLRRAGPAAHAVSEQPYAAPKAQQWIYMKVAEYGANSGGHPTFREDWIRFDGRQEADVQGGKLVVSTHRGSAGGDEGTPQGAAALLRSLPADPRALIAVLAERVGTEPRGDAAPGRDGLLFANIVQLIRDAPAGIPPKTQAALYRAIATLHGVRVDENAVDGLGRHLIGVTQGTTGHFILIDPATHRIVGFQNVWSGRPTPAEVTMAKDKKLNIDLPKGTVTYGLVTVTTAVVDHPGQR